MTTCGTCPACAIHRELTTYRDTTYADWSKARGLLSFAAVIAERACPEYRPTPPPAAPACQDDPPSEGASA